IRSACVMKLPGRIPAGTTSEAAFCSVDLLPTIAHLTDAPLPKNEIDGRNVWDLIVGKAGAVNPHDYYPFSTGRRFEGVVSGDGRWKLHLPHAYRTLAKAGQDGRPGKYTPQQIGLSLYDLRTDPGETVNVADKHPQVLAKLTALAKEHQRTFYEASR
ncbi:MAG: arylsulfatase, partial [Planctomycetaceae bacterium]